MLEMMGPSGVGAMRTGVHAWHLNSQNTASYIEQVRLVGHEALACGALHDVDARAGEPDLGTAVEMMVVGTTVVVRWRWC